ncbi:probable carotenoid cleavage dioxygenase 4, chloroplastic [Aristolochia californica]|uniref:probable carotenoid cleavage dioxygenase 4, chloroplastic n=1 Tax=Aristolochia californica TaxID=171875 RepID=UPI0035D5ED9B
MDAFSSSFFTPVPSVPVPPPSKAFFFLPNFTVFSVRTEDRPSSKPTSKPPQQPPGNPSSYNKLALIQEKKKNHFPPLQRLTVAVCDVVDDMINRFVDPAFRRPSFDPKHVLTGIYAPVAELPPTECSEVEGELPPCLAGAYIRNGPNPKFFPQSPYHLFDGNGMLHSLLLSQDRAIFCSRFVKTYKFQVEEKAGRAVYPNLFSAMHGFGGIVRIAIISARASTGQVDYSKGCSPANTSVAMLGNKLLALWESDLPYAVRLTSQGDISTLGRCNFDGKLSAAMTAHPKLDHDTGEVFAFRCEFTLPYLTYFWFDSNGHKQQDVPIYSLQHRSLIHDFAITKQYAVFVDVNIVIDPLRMISGEGRLFGKDETKVSRIGVIPRYASDESEMTWLDVPGLNAIHIINAWDEINDDGTDSIVMVAPSVHSVQDALQEPHLIRNSVEKVKINLKTGEVQRIRLAENLDWGVINPGYTGKKSRYVYMARATGVAKLDMDADGGENCVVAEREWGPDCFAGEPFFVARHPDDGDAEEDDGYVVTFMHDSSNAGAGESRFLVMDAKSATLQIVASVKLPGRVPYGFHGLFVSERDLRRQSSNL